MSFEFNYSVNFDLPKWVERIHDYVWQEDDEEDA